MKQLAKAKRREQQGMSLRKKLADGRTSIVLNTVPVAAMPNGRRLLLGVFGLRKVDNVNLAFEPNHSQRRAANP